MYGKNWEVNCFLIRTTNRSEPLDLLGSDGLTDAWVSDTALELGL
ncbi:hypothetical protein CIPAW_11G099300 [Carya illinoinensis]|uniref:Uncharacterized protein n=1 Tax=Carya illinoinensis TaxID=32201 RepID=A0A8T1P1Z3_CARIL|nr:hypothetical protein CIPAW_11G099300 [Carya illinoinensis]